MSLTHNASAFDAQTCNVFWLDMILLMWQSESRTLGQFGYEVVRDLLQRLCINSEKILEPLDLIEQVLREVRLRT